MRKIHVIILYIRLSVEDTDTHENGKDESNSVSNQREMLRAFVEKEREFAGCQVIELCDDGYSGTNMNRPAMTKLLELVKKGEADCIIVKDFSRFGRDYLTVSDYLDQIFPFMGIRFISINDHYDSAKCHGVTSGVDIAFRNVIYGYYSQDLSLKVKSGKRTKAQNGDFLSPFAPIGYQKSPDNKNQLIVEPEGAEIVQRIFRMAGEGKSVLQIVRKLNSDGVSTPSELKNRMGYFHKWWESIREERLWDTGIVIIILRDERYLGKNVFGKRQRITVGSYQTRRENRSQWIVTEECHEPIVTAEEFAAANATLREYVEAGKMAGENYLFRGKVRCGNCGYAMAHIKKPTPRFTCTTHYRYTDCGCAKGHIKVSELAEAVLSAIHIYVKALLDEMQLLKSAENDGRIPELQKQLAALQRNVAGMKEQKAQLYDLLVDEKIDRADFKEKQGLLTKRQTDMEQKQQQLQSELTKWECLISTKRVEEQQLEDYANMEELTIDMVETLIECIYVYNDSSVHIQWRFENEIEK